MINRGSEWHKWDLHVHTPESGMANEFNCTWDKYVQELFKNAIANDIVALGITDYFTIEGYKKLKEEYLGNETKLNSLFTPEEIEKIKHILVLPNIEFRLKTLVNNQRVNYHILLSPDLTIHQIEENFLHNIDFVYQDMPFETANVRKLKKCNLEELGKKLKEQQPTFHGSNFEVGCKTAIVDNAQIKKILIDCKDIFGGKYLVIIPVDEDLSDISWNSQEHMVRKALYQEANVFFATNKNTIEFGLGKKHADVHLFIDEFKSLKPCICGSDAHKLSTLGVFPNNNCCWIKADTTFEGLKQIIYEPERVKIQEHTPENKSGYQVIDSIKLDKQNIWQGEIGLNPNLNTIIGGRSTGKSTLLQCIARKISPIAEMDEHLSNYINPLLDGISITWKDGAVDVSREIDFFTQNYMYNIASKPAELKKVIGNIIKEKDTEKNLEKYTTICNSINIQLSTFINQLIILQQNIGLKNQELREKGDRSGIEHEIKSIEEKIEQIKAGATITKEEIDLYNKIVAQITEEESKIKTYQADLLQLRNLDKVSLFDTYYTNRLLLISEATRSNILQHYQNIVKDTDEQWQTYITGAIKQIETSIDAAQAIILQKKADAIYIKGDAYFKSNQEYLGLQEKLETERKKLALIIECKKQLDRLISDANTLKESIVITHNKYKQECLKALEHLHYKGNGVDVMAKYVCRTNDLSSFLTTRHNVRSNANFEYVNNFISTYDGEDNSSVLNKYIDDCLSGKIEYKGGHVNTNVLMELFTTNWYDIKYDLKYEKDPFEKMSPGKKAFVVLKLLLEFSEKQCPILIDQPEDSLDNRAIYNELVKYIRTKKESRQIILVTHNSNVVVSADAENVIVANQQGDDVNNCGNNKFQYINGPLENTKPKDKDCLVVLESQGIREHVCEIMEGGIEAFEKREQRYGLR